MVARSRKPIKCMLKTLFRKCCKDRQIICKKQTVDPTVTPSSTRLWTSIQFIYCRLWREWWQHSSLLESKTHDERLWFNSVDSDTNFCWAWIWLHGQERAAINRVLTQHTPKFFTRADGSCAFSRPTKHV